MNYIRKIFLATLLATLSTPLSSIPCHASQEIAPDLSAEEHAFHAFLDAELADVIDSAFIARFKTDEVFRRQIAILGLKSKTYTFIPNDDSAPTENIRFDQLPEETREKYIEVFIESYSMMLEELAKKIADAKPSWHGLTLSDLAYLLPFCYISGRQVRGADSIPGSNELLTPTAPLKIAGDIMLGWTTNILATLFHECGHAVTKRIFYGCWPESVTIGTNDHSRPALISLFEGKLALRGINLSGVTVSKTGFDPREARALPFLAAGGICGMMGYYGIKQMIYSIQGKTLSVSKEFEGRHDYIMGLYTKLNLTISNLLGLKNNAPKDPHASQYNENSIMMLPFLLDLATWLELRNVILDTNVDGSDAHHIAVCIEAQLDNLREKMFKKTSN